MVNKNNPLRDSRHLEKYFPYVDFFRRPTSSDIRHPKTGRIYSTPFFWRVNLKPDGTSPDTGNEGELWYLEDITANVADWKLLIFTTSGTQIITITGDSGGAVAGDGTGDMDLIGKVVANATRAKPVFVTGTPASFKQEIEVQLATAVTPTPGDTNDVGMISANENHFTVDATSGMLSIKGGAVTPPVSKVDVDFNTAPGVDPVVATAAGVIQIYGNTVTNGTNTNAPVATHSRAVNQFHMDVQLSTAVAASPADPYDVGLCSFDNSQFTVDSNGFVQLLGGFAGEAANLGFDLTSGRFQMTQADGSALSSSNPGRARVQTKGSFAQNQVIKLVKPYKFDDDSHASTHDLVGWGPGLNGSTGTTWTSDRPFFVYVVQHDTASSDPAVGISLIPDYSVAPAAGLLNVSGTISSSAQGSMFLLSISDGMGGWTAPTVGNYDGNPCVCIGSFKMTYTDTGMVDWTVTAFDGTDGVGQFQEGVQFTLPAGQRGAAASKYFQDNGGTAPGFSSNSPTYYITRDGYCFFRWTFVNATVAGAGAFTLRLTDPYDAQSRSSGSVWHDENTAVTVYTYVAGVSPSNPYITFLKSGTAGSVLNTAILAGATGDNFNGSAYYKIDR